MKANGLFITGTDTGVGKTFVTAALVAALRDTGTDAVAFKPVQTGCPQRKGRMVPSDIECCNRLSGIGSGELAVQSPYRFRDACSPHLAAARAGRMIEPRKIISCFRILSAKHEFIAAEGAGGALVPIRGKYCMADLIRDLGLPALIVARAGVGTLNHTLLTVEALRRRRIKIAGIILNQPEPARHKYIISDNIRTIEKLSGIRVLAALDHFA